MAIFNPSNQLLQIDTGQALTYLYNPALSSAGTMYAGIGENQVLGQRYFSVTNVTKTNPYGAPAIYMNVLYKSTAQPAPVAGPAPVYWTDETFTTVSGVESEGLAGFASTAGYLMPNTTSYSVLTAAILQGAQVLIQVAGLLQGAYAPTGGSAGVGNMIVPAAGNWVTNGVATSDTTGGVSARPFGWQLTVIASGLCDVLVSCDII